jgi:hypothetical protein
MPAPASDFPEFALRFACHNLPQECPTLGRAVSFTPGFVADVLANKKAGRTQRKDK